MTTTVTINPLNIIVNNNNNNNNTNTNNDFFGIDACAGGNGFEFASDWSRPYFKSAHQAISRCELWNWLQTYEPEKDRGFMFARNVPELYRLNNVMMNDPVNGGHSGASYACTMRNMEFIAKHGYQRFKDDIIKEQEIKNEK
jgi:hypothetical protein